MTGVCRFLRRIAVIGALAMAGSWWGLTAKTLAESCPNEQIRLEQGYGSALPDCRSYEQVSPTQKNLSDDRGAAGVVQSSPSGDAVTSFSIIPFPGIVEGSANYPVYRSQRNENGWKTEGLMPPSAAGWPYSEVLGWTENLSATFVSAAEPQLAAGAVPELTNFYIRNNATGNYELLAPGVADQLGRPYEGYFATATPDGAHILFESEAALLSGATQGTSNVYEWDKGNGQLSLISADAAVGPAGGAKGKFYTQNAVSGDGSRVFFTDLSTGRVDLKESGEAQPEAMVAVSAGPAEWEAATPSGGEAFYSEAGELYRFDIEDEQREMLAKEVIGVLGVSEDGSSVYFVKASGGLYLWQEGTIVSIGQLDQSADNADWFARCACNGVGPASGEKTSAVTPNGKTLLFSSVEPLTGYDNLIGNTNFRYNELYVYEAPTGARAQGGLMCVSCNPTTNRATASAYIEHAPPGPTAQVRPLLTRNLSADGARVFFQTEEALIPSDTNGRADVYEWEREGDGSCPAEAGNASGGCLFLISTGQGASESYFGDASADGNDVFFFTRQSLVSQDQDANTDLYDASVGGGIQAQNLSPAVPCAAEECHGTPAAAAILGPPASATFVGADELTPEPDSQAATPFKSGSKSKPSAKKPSAKNHKRRQRKKARRSARKAHKAANRWRR